MAVANEGRMGGEPDDHPDRLREMRIDAAMQGILSYLRMHPDSADSLRGVRLWLRMLSDELNEEIVALALERLTRRGEIVARRVPGGATVYGRGQGHA
jgi:hypothetical protein